GEMKVDSTPGVGSAFSLYLPRSFASAKVARKQESPVQQRIPLESPALAMQSSVSEDVASYVEGVLDDRATVRPGDKVILIVDNDTSFSKYLLDLAHENGFKGLVTSRGGT